jgi:hypothetical protein
MMTAKCRRIADGASFTLKEIDVSKRLTFGSKKKRLVRLTAKQAPHRPGITRGARFARTRVMMF